MISFVRSEGQNWQAYSAPVAWIVYVDQFYQVWKSKLQAYSVPVAWIVHVDQFCQVWKSKLTSVLESPRQRQWLELCMYIEVQSKHY